MSVISQELTVMQGKPLTLTITINITISQDGKVTFTTNTASAPGHVATVMDGHLIKSECKRWSDVVGAKEVNSCRGCTIRCLLKDQYHGKIEIPA